MSLGKGREEATGGDPGSHGGGLIEVFIVLGIRKSPSEREICKQEKDKSKYRCIGRG